MDLDKLDVDGLLQGVVEGTSIQRVSKEQGTNASVAVIGMSARIADAENLDEFWTNIEMGKSSVRSIPSCRKSDVQEYLRLHNALYDDQDEQYLNEAFLSDIDKFDYRFFGMSKQEANLTDPNQRLFLEAAWTTVEEAGYGGASIAGTKTGVFVGLSNDFGEDYRRIVDTFAPDSPEIAIVGNIKSVIASRLAYYLDLKGPSMVVDTACSSGLVALHQACHSIRSGECEMALAGTVKTHLIPMFEDTKRSVGMKDIQDTFAADNRCKAFDESSDGMSIGEGVIVFMLKSLDKALEHKDQIHCVIRGSAINQDGKSIGLTAPNGAAQAEVILSAQENAKINTESVSYVEAHGTGTKLGDPIEVSGLTKAFRTKTDRKQYCGIGSVKTNIGHLDNASGLASLAKVAMSIKNEKIPASLNFIVPNSKIPFEYSPLYVVDRLTHWPLGDSGTRIAGINSFGLSGTNCHVIVESPPLDNTRNKDKESSDIQYYLLPISAKTTTALKRLILSYKTKLQTNRVTDWTPAAVCSLAALGRQHFKHRFAVVFKDMQELQLLLDNPKHIVNSDSASNCFYSFDKQSDSVENIDGSIVDLIEKSRLGDQESLIGLARQYCNNCAVDWEKLYEGGRSKKVSLPTYPFARDRCWVETSEAGENLLRSDRSYAKISHPLVHELRADTLGTQIYMTRLSTKTHWELSEHKVRGVYVLPGTCYLEMIMQVVSVLDASKEMTLEHKNISISKVQFLTPFIVRDELTEKELHTKLSISASEIRIEIQSYDETSGWQVHAEARIKNANNSVARSQTSEIDLETTRIDELRLNLDQPVYFSIDDDQSRGLEIGGHWNDNFENGWSDDEGSNYLISLCLPKQYRKELSCYYYHPALFDTAINAANHLVGDGDLYLPLSYENITVFKALEERVYARIALLSDRCSEVVQFNIDLLNENGDVCAMIERYSVKKVADSQSFDDVQTSPVIIETRLQELSSDANDINNMTVNDLQRKKPVLILHRGDGCENLLISSLRKAGVNLSAIDIGVNEQISQSTFEDIDINAYAGILVIAIGFGDPSATDQQALMTFYQQFNSLLNLKSINNTNVIVLTENGFSVDADIRPVQSAIASVVKVAALESPQTRISTLDVDQLSGEGIGQRVYTFFEKRSENSSLVLRANKTHLQELMVIDKAVMPSSLLLSQGGVYVITGGTGALGLEVASELSRQAHESQTRITLVLGHSGTLPDVGEWGEEELQGRQRKQVEKIRGLYNDFTQLVCPTMVLADRNKLRELLVDLREKHGPIRGVFHVAGRAGDGFMRNKTVDQLSQVLSPKISGLANLDALTSGDPLEFFVSFSSISSLIVEPGQTDYTAANRYMDAVIQRRHANGLPALSVRWPAWTEAGMAIEYDALSYDELFLPITPKDGIEALKYAMNNSRTLPPVLVIATVNSGFVQPNIYEGEFALDDSLRAYLVNTASKPVTSSKMLDSDVLLLGDDVPDEVSVAVGNVWGKVLGDLEIDIDLSFNDLGGNSILTTQLYREFDKLFPGAIDMADLFTQTTIRSQASLLRRALGLPEPGDSATSSITSELNESPERTQDEILQRLASGDLSPQEAARYI